MNGTAGKLFFLSFPALTSLLNHAFHIDGTAKLIFIASRYGDAKSGQQSYLVPLIPLQSALRDCLLGSLRFGLTDCSPKLNAFKHHLLDTGTG